MYSILLLEEVLDDCLKELKWSSINIQQVCLLYTPVDSSTNYNNNSIITTCHVHNNIGHIKFMLLLTTSHPPVLKIFIFL